MKWLKKFAGDWLNFFQDNNFQEDLFFLVYVTLLLKFNIIPLDAFVTLAVVIIGGDALKKLGAKK